MPELPDVTLYVDAIARRARGERLEDVRFASPFVLRTVEPRKDAIANRKIDGVERIGKRIVLALEGDRFVVIHLMVAGRFRWDDAKGAKIPGRVGLCAFDLSSGTLILTEASKKKRAQVHFVAGREALRSFDRGGLDVMGADLAAFRGALARERHTLKRALTDPRLFDGIGNAYSDEILHAAQLSPLKRTDQLSEEESARLFEATQSTLRTWIARLAAETGEGFPQNVTAFRPEMAVHGKHKQPCPVCGAPVQRIVYAENESNYCARCQTGGKLLADRSLSRLLKDSWPKTIEELEGR